MKHWVLEWHLFDVTTFYAGDGTVTVKIEDAFRFGTEELANEFRNRAEGFHFFKPVQYEVVYKKVG